MKSIPFEMRPYLHPKQPAAINPGPVPAAFVHSWAVDIKGFNSFRLAVQPGRLVLDWPQDTLSIVDAYGQTLHTYASLSDVAKTAVTVQPTAFDSGQSHVRFYIVLETSSRRMNRRFEPYGLTLTGTPSGGEEALLAGDDLNYEPTRGAFFRTPGGAEPEQPWRPRGGSTNPFAPPLPRPDRDDGWFLLGKNTTDPEGGFLSLISYNEQTSRLRAYLYNDN